MLTNSDYEFEEFSIENMEKPSKSRSELQKHTVSGNESDSVAESSNSEDTENINNFSEEMGSTQSLSQGAKPLDVLYFFQYAGFKDAAAETKCYAKCKQTGEKDRFWFPTSMEEK